MSEERFGEEEVYGLEDEHALVRISDRDLADPVEWLTRLTPYRLKLWLRGAIWHGQTLPLSLGAMELLVPHLDRLLRCEEEREGEGKKGRHSALTVNLRVAVPALLAEWGSRDRGECLDDLLVLCAKLRCAGAVPSIASIATERLGGRPDEVRLRKRCLSVLAGLDVTEQTVPVFNGFFNQYDYTPFCYRALYRNNLSYAVQKLPALLRIYRERREYARLRQLLDLLLFKHLNGEQRAQNLWQPLLLKTPAPVLREMLLGLQEVHITFLPAPDVPMPHAHQNYVEVTYLLPEEERSDRPPDRVGTEGMSLPARKAILDCGYEYSKRNGGTMAA